MTDRRRFPSDDVAKCPRSVCGVRPCWVIPPSTGDSVQRAYVPVAGLSEGGARGVPQYTLRYHRTVGGRRKRSCVSSAAS